MAKLLALALIAALAVLPAGGAMARHGGGHGPHYPECDAICEANKATGKTPVMTNAPASPPEYQPVHPTGAPDTGVKNRQPL